MKIIIAIAALAAGSGLAAGAASAQVSVSGSVGTTGGTVEAKIKVAPIVAIRGGYNYFQYEADDTYDDIAYQGDLDLSTAGAFVDVHPFGNAFMLTGGAYFGEKTLDLFATPTTNVQIGNQTYTPAQVGTLNLTGDLEDTAPFVGLGWDTSFDTSGLGFRFIAGAMFTGTPAIDLTASGGTLSNDPGFQTQLANEVQNLQDDIDDYEIYPVVQVGLSLTF